MRFLLVLFTCLFAAVQAQDDPNNAKSKFTNDESTERVTICHRTCSDTNPWVRITIDNDAWWDYAANGHNPSPTNDKHGHRLADCNFDKNPNKNRDAWGYEHDADYLLKWHGSRADVAEGFANGTITEWDNTSVYWELWEPACPYANREKCCALDGDYKYCCGMAPTPAPTPPPTPPPTPQPTPPDGDPNPPSPGSLGDPHFRTWKNEHFEYHGQCDLVLTKDKNFADGLGLDVQVRTKLIRFWSYIKQAAIRIGDDILEVEGSPVVDQEDRYWINLEFQGKLDTVGGFPVTSWWQNTFKKHYLIDLDSKFPGQKIKISTYKEFVRVDFINASAEAFGNTVGILGDFKTGKTMGRDGSTVLNDFMELGNEWQVLPVEDMLFHDISEPQFPKKCIEPEDPQGQRRRRLGENTVSEVEAEKACARLKDPADRKDCVYDILATQDLEMVGAY